MRNVLTIDSTAMHVLGDLIRRSRRDGMLVSLTAVRSRALMAMARRDLLDEIGDDCLFGSVEDAMERARGDLIRGSASPRT